LQPHERGADDCAEQCAIGKVRIFRTLQRVRESQVTADSDARRYFRRRSPKDAAHYRERPARVMTIHPCLALIFQKYRGHHAIAEQNQNQGAKKLSSQGDVIPFSFLILHPVERRVTPFPLS